MPASRLRRHNGNDRACIGTTSSSDYASLRRTNTTERHMHRDGKSGRPCKDTTEQRQGQQMRRAGDALARACIATSAKRQRQFRRCHAPRRQEQRRLCIATANQRQRNSMHRDGESKEHYASLRRRNGSDKHASIRQEQRRLCIATGKERQGQRTCTATARAGQTMHRPTAAQSIHCDGESSIDYASLRQNDGSDSSCIATARAGDYARIQRRDDRHAKTTTCDTQ